MVPSIDKSPPIELRVTNKLSLSVSPILINLDEAPSSPKVVVDPEPRKLVSLTSVVVSVIEIVGASFVITVKVPSSLKLHLFGSPNLVEPKLT